MDAIADQSVVAANTSRSRLRYPLRSASKPKEDISTTSSAPKRGKPASNVSKSVSVLDLSVKDKSTKPPRRLSIPAKSTASPVPRPTSTITPISETRVKRSNNGQGKSGTPVSDVSKSMNQRKFCVLSSASYWLSQIKLSESAAKHSISLGFFKLALESGCEPIQRMRDELKSYARRHNLVELGEPVKELFRSYMLEDIEQLQVSETCSQLPDGAQSSDEDVHSSSTTGPRKLKPKSLNSENFQVSKVAEPARKENSQKRFPANKNRNSVNLKSVTGTGGEGVQKRLSKKEENKEKAKIKNQGKKSAVEKDPVDTLPVEKTQKEDKENMDAQQMEEISLTEAI